MIDDLEKIKTLSYTEGECMNSHKLVNHPVISSSSEDDWDQDYDGGLAVEEEKPKLKPPKQYKVIVINDDYTPMEFVVQVLIMFFAMDEAKATRVMMSVHTKGKGICGIFSHEIAETKVDQVNEYSRMNQHPLMCTMEEA
jgi:ATP-dependent Clp protease adaptor protein ClpS